MTTKDFIKKARKKHKNFYIYDKVEYKNNSTKVIITCPIHGDFEQIPANHLYGYKCMKCSIIQRSDKRKMTHEKFLEKANNIHNNKYLYLSKYQKSSLKIKIKCKKCNNIFEQTPNNHLIKKQGCPICFGNKKKTHEDFVKEANKIHINKYKYPEKYINNNTKIKIICPIHGVFEQTPANHNHRGDGCPKCGIIKSRLKLLKRLQKNLKNGYQITPNFNPKACKIFNNISEKKNIHIQHAMNGGEFYIKELGYWVDGYDKENNTVYEFDEKYHDFQKEKDIIREQEIINLLGCEFIRIKN